MTVRVDLQPTLGAVLETPLLWNLPTQSPGCRGTELGSRGSPGCRALRFHSKLSLGPRACLCPLTIVTVSDMLLTTPCVGVRPKSCLLGIRSGPSLVSDLATSLNLFQLKYSLWARH